MEKEHLYHDLKSPTLDSFDVNAINNAVKNIIRTPVGSVCGMPDFGSRLNEVLFEPIDHITIDLVKQLIQEAIYKFEDRIIIVSIDVQGIPEYNRLLCTIKYRFKDDIFNRTSTLSLDLNG